MALLPSYMSSTCRAYVRRALGVRFVLQGRDPRVGLDCVGLVFGALLEGGWEPEDPEFLHRKSYRLGDTAHNALGEMNREWEEVWLQKPDCPVFYPEIVLPGDILACRDFSGKPGVRHLLWVDSVAPDLVVYHADTEQGKVVCHSIGEMWENQIVGVYRPFDWSNEPNPWGAARGDF